MTSSEKDQIFAQLQQIQTENAKLHELISKRKAERKFQNEDVSETVDTDQSQDYAAQIEQIKQQLNTNEAELTEMKKELAQLMKTQDEIQYEIDEQNNQVYQYLIPKLKEEEQQTIAFYDNLIAQCSQYEEIDIKSLESLVKTVQDKRNSVNEKQEQHEKILRLILFNKSQTNHESQEEANAQQTENANQHSKTPIQHPLPKPEQKEKAKKRPSAMPQESPFDNPLPCFQLSAPQLNKGSQRRRQSLAAKKKT